MTLAADASTCAQSKPTHLVSKVLDSGPFHGIRSTQSVALRTERRQVAICHVPLDMEQVAPNHIILVDHAKADQAGNTQLSGKALSGKGTNPHTGVALVEYRTRLATLRTCSANIPLPFSASPESHCYRTRIPANAQSHSANPTA